METPQQTEARAQALAYLKAKGTDTATPTLITRVRTALNALEACLEAVPADRASRRVREDEWSVQEIGDHVLETHRPLLDELHCLLAGQRPPGPPIPASLQSKAPLLRPWARILRDLKRVHEDLVTTLLAAPPDFTTSARVPVVMVINVPAAAPYEWVEDLDWKAYGAVVRLHAIDHLNQAKKVLAGAGSALSERPT